MKMKTSIHSMTKLKPKKIRHFTPTFWFCSIGGNILIFHFKYLYSSIPNKVFEHSYLTYYLE